MKRLTGNPTFVRFIACVFGGFVLALMIGDQEGAQDDFGISFRQATSEPRLLIFLLIGVAIFFAISFWTRVVPYLNRPGALPVGIGFIAVLVAMVLMNWYDPVGKFDPLVTRVDESANVPALVSVYFSWFGWVLWIVALLLGGVAVFTRNRMLGYVQLGLGVFAAVLCFVAHQQLVNFAGGIDHSLGYFVASLGFLVYASAGLSVARAKSAVAEPRRFLEEAMSWRPGLPLISIATVVGVIGFFDASWFAPLALNTDLLETHDLFNGTGVGAFTLAYLAWLGLALFAIGVVTGLIGSYQRMRILGWVTLAAGTAGVVITFIVLHQLTTKGAELAIKYGKTWQNLGDGGWVVCIAFGVIAIAGYLVATAPRMHTGPANPNALPVHAAVERAKRSIVFKPVVPLALLIAVFYPPTLPITWQNVIVTQIGVYILLTVGLNVVVGWAGLLDLGYIAFYGIGSYTTAYFVGVLPVKPPSWLTFSPLWAIPFAIGACLIAGVLLGAPTLRLRGDYLAIVTLGFGEIIQLLAINNPFDLTGGPVGPNVPHPVFHVGPINITWGLDNLPYWYLLLIFIIVMVVLFYRLEGSRLGRAWAAIREDEVAAQATGINTTRAKLLAFAIGASTSGLAGVFFASQVGYFDPSQFTLQNSILIVAYVVFGGMGSLPGAIAGAAVLTWLPQFLKEQVPLNDRQMWIGVLIMLMMIFRPAGLIPAKRRAAELHGLDEAPGSEVRAVPASEGI